MSKQVFSERFEVQELIAEGGMGAVYKVLDTKLDRVAALKVVHSHLSSDADFVERFRDEARKTARLQGHPNIVQIFDVANDHGTEYLVMEYFPSTNLRDQLRSQGKFPLRDAINVTRQIAQALMKSHSCDIIHRDIKPANILLDNNQFVKLTDFGIAKALSDAPLTSTGQLIGTLKYMSPEQARNTILDGKTDLYSLGMVLYELVTGKNLWKDVPNLAIYGNLQAETTIPMLNFSSNVPQGVQAVIQDLLRFDPTDRIQHAEALIARLEDLREICEDPDATIVKPRVQEPESLEDDKTVAVLHPPSSAPSGQKSVKHLENQANLTKNSPLEPKKITLEDGPRSINPVESNTKKTIRNSVFATIILLFIGGYYYVNTLPPKLDTDFEQNTDTVIKVIEDQKESQPLRPEEVRTSTLDGNQTATEKSRVAQEKAIATTKAAVEAQAAEKTRVARAEAEAQAAEEARVAQAAAAAEAQDKEKTRVAQEKAAAESQAIEEARVAQAQAAATAKAKKEARIAQELAAAKAQAEEKARVTETNAAAQAAEEARVAEASAAAKAHDAEQAQIAEAKAAAQVEVTEKARAAESKAIAQGKAAEKARVAEAKAAAEAKTAEKARIAKAKAAAQAAETQALNTLLAELQRSISKRDLKALKAISTMSTSRQNMLENLFARYQTIETSIGDLTRTDDKATVILQFTKFVRPNGEIVQPSRFLKTTNVVIPKDANGWGLLNW